MIFRILLISAIALSLSGCFSSTPVKPVQVEYRTKTVPVFHPPLPDGVSMGQVKWKVLTPAIMEEYLRDLKAGKAPVIVFYGITPKGYETLAGNIAELKRYIKQQKAIIMYYRKNLKEMAAPEPPKQEVIPTKPGKKADGK